MTLEEAKQKIKIGSKYQHFKGKIYTVDFIATDTNLGDIVVVYHNDFNEYFVRRAKEWFDVVSEPILHYTTRFKLIVED